MPPLWRWLKNAGSNTLYKQVRVVRMCGVRRVVKTVREEDRGERRARFLLNKEVSRTKQLMSLRLGGPARGFVLITSRRESEHGEVHEGEEKSRSLSSFSSLFLSLSLFLDPPLCVLLSFWLLFRSFIAAMGGEEEDRASLKSKSQRKDRTMKEGRREANRAQDNSKLSHGPTHDGVRATLFADGRGTRLRIRFLPGFPDDRLTVHFLRARLL